MNQKHSIFCPFCSSCRITKKGFDRGKQRYKCKHCTRKFVNSQKHNSFKLVYEFLLNKSLRSFDSIKKDLLHRSICDIAYKLPKCQLLNKYLNIKFSGRIGLDAIFLKVEGGSMAALIAFDLDSFDVINVGVYDSECEASWTDFLSTLSYCLTNTYPKLFVSDGKKGINNSLKKLYEEVPRQVCVAHKLRRLEQIFPRIPTPYERILKEQTTRTLLSNSMEEFKDNEKQLLKIISSSSLRSRSPRYSIIEIRKARRVRGIIRYQKNDFLTQFRYPELVKEDRSNNSLEGVVNSFLKTRIKLFRGFKSRELVNYWINLLVLYYRFHTFKASKYKWRNGKTPVETNWDLDQKKYLKLKGKASHSWIPNLLKLGFTRSAF